MDVNLLAYTAIDGIPTMTDSEVMGLYGRMEEDGTADTVFYDGSVRSAEDFLNAMKKGLNRLFMVSIDRGVSGVIWLNDFEVRRAAFHFCFFSNAWGKDLVKAGKKCVIYLLNMENGDEYPIFDALTGLVPIINERANEWCLKMGFSVLGTLPKASWIHSLQKSVPGTIYYVERGHYG